MEKDRAGRDRRRVPKRHRLARREFTFRKVDRRLIATTQYERIWVLFTTPRSYIYGREPTVPHPPTTVYLHDDGSPIDDLSRFILERDTTNLLCVVLGRFRPELQMEPPKEANQEEWDEYLADQGLQRLGSDSPSPGGASKISPEFIARRSEDYTDYSHIITSSPVHWDRWVRKRLALFFGCAQKDRRIELMAAYLGQIRNWYHWMGEPELAPILERLETDEHLQRLMNIVMGFTRWRSGIIQSRDIRRLPFDLNINTPRGKFVFRFPSAYGRQKNAIERQERVHLQIHRIAPYLVSKLFFDPRWLAAGVYTGRQYLIVPKRLVGQIRTYEDVAREFGLTREQVKNALRRVRRPDFPKRFWDYHSRHKPKP